jgi:hypothetical protein
MPFKGFICESNKEKVTPDACLACSLQGGLPGCHFTPPVVRGIIANSTPRNLRGGPSVTELLGCPRKLILGRRVDYWEKPSRRTGASGARWATLWSSNTTLFLLS